VLTLRSLRAGTLEPVHHDIVRVLFSQHQHDRSHAFSSLQWAAYDNRAPALLHSVALAAITLENAGLLRGAINAARGAVEVLPNHPGTDGITPIGREFLRLVASEWNSHTLATARAGAWGELYDMLATKDPDHSRAITEAEADSVWEHFIAVHPEFATVVPVPGRV
jgi:hypothetical protein